MCHNTYFRENKPNHVINLPVCLKKTLLFLIKMMANLYIPNRF